MRKSIIYILVLFISLAGCVENDPKIEHFPGDRIAFSYKVVGEYELDYYVGSTIQFTNESEAVGNVTWDFGDGTKVNDQNPTHIFQNAGTYDVTLTMEGEGKISRRILISDIVPQVEIKVVEDDIVEVNKTYVKLSVFTPNPQELPIEYSWEFPEGTVNTSDDIVESALGEDPGELKFKNIGSQRIILKTKLGDRYLEERVTNVQVGYSSPAKTIYYAAKGGNIMAYKLIENLPEGVKNNPFNMGVKSGQHPMNILFHESSLYVLDPGKQFTYVNDEEGVLGDGRIFVMASDGSRTETVISNNGGAAFSDPFYGAIEDEYLYFTDRNTGIRRVGVNERNLVLDPEDGKYNFWVQNATLNYYNVAYQYGAMNACFMRLSTGVWWWSKTYNGVGIFRFKESDILPNATSGGNANDPYPVMAGNLFIKSFVVDEANRMVYYAVRDKGFYKATMDEFESTVGASNPGTLVSAIISDGEGSAGEYVDICQMALDPEDGSVYFGYRAESGSSVVSGLKRYNPATNAIESIVDNVEIYGVAINHTKTKLFN